VLVSDVLVGGRYRLEERIGFGGMAEVWRATDLSGNRPVAVKLLAEGTGDARRFAAEVRVLSRVSHPAVVRFLGAGDHHGRLYLVMELVEGETLADRLAGGPLPAAGVARLGAVLAGALGAAHRVGIVHRDVKPANVLLDAAGHPHLADFGVSRLVGAATITGTGWVVGTAGYLAPEQVEAAVVGPPADVYALGLVLLECLTGERAFPGGAVQAAAARLTRDPEVPAGLPAPWPALLTAMTARDPLARPSADAVADALGAGRTVAAPPPAGQDATRLLPAATPPVPSRPAGAAAAAARVAPAGSGRGPRPARRPRRRRRPLPLVLVGAVLLALGLLVVVAFAGMADDTGRSVPTTTTTGSPAAPPATAAPAPTTPATTAPPATPPPTTTATTAPTTTTTPPTTEPGRPDDPGNSGRGHGGGGGGGNGRGNG
jgi:eukaryotic-like serine/threonine-protein kinase